jgi:23S rRNA (cytosine1962-C5)-methyltransferase
MHNRIILKPKRDLSVQRKHPWIFSGAIQATEGDLDLGTTVAVQSHEGEFLAWGHYSPHSQIRVRLISWDETEDCDSEAFWMDKLAQAIQARHLLRAEGNTTAYRLVNAENDSMPGLIVDKYQDVLVVQFLSAGVEIRKSMFVNLLSKYFLPETIYERSDADVRQKEGLPRHTGLLYGKMPEGSIEILENNLRFLVDIIHGHKSGFYLDQRQNRLSVKNLARRIVQDGIHPRLLNVFSYTGGFTVYGLTGGAGSAVNIDTSTESLQLGRDILALNNIRQSNVRDMNSGAFEALRTLRRDGELFDIIILDPPKFASTQRDIQRATRGYKDINMQAIHLLAPGGYLFTFSCSGAISDDLFQKIIFGAALDSQRHLQIVGKLTQSEDHPVSISFPEGAYLKGLVCHLY